MFTALASILGANETLDVSITAPDANGLMKVVVKPKAVSGKNVALAQPLALVGLPEELDADFAGTLAQYAAGRTSLQQQVEVTTTILAEAKQAEVGKATKALSQKGKGGASPAPQAAASDDSQDDGDDDILGTDGATGTPSAQPESSPVAAPAPTAPAPAAGANDDLLSALL